MIILQLSIFIWTGRRYQLVESMTKFSNYLPWLRCRIRQQFIHPWSTQAHRSRYSILGQLDGVWRNRRLSLNTKLRLYTSLVQSVLLHGSETWTLTETNSTRQQAFHVKAQRRILNIKWYLWRSIVVRTLVSAGELSLSCAGLLAGWVITLRLSRPLSVSQHGQLSHPSLRDR